MKKKILMKLVCFFIITFVFVSFFQSTMAWSINMDTDFSRGETMQNSDTTGMQEARDTAAKIISSAISVIQVIGIGIAIIMLTSLGIKYMVGSIEDKAQVKKHATIYVLGAVVFFAAAAILQIIQGFIKANFVV